MSRITKTADEIRAEIIRSAHSIYVKQAGAAKVEVPFPMRHAPDTEGCNWNIKIFRNISGHEREMAKILRQARSQFNLPELPF